MARNPKAMRSPYRAGLAVHESTAEFLDDLRSVAGIELSLQRDGSNPPPARLLHSVWMSLRAKGDKLGPSGALEGPARALVAACYPFLTPAGQTGLRPLLRPGEAPPPEAAPFSPIGGEPSPGESPSSAPNENQL